MRRKILVQILIMIVFVTSIRGQNNLDFESWVMNPQGIEEPEFWETNSLQNFVCVSKSTNPSSGTYSALVTSNGISFEGKAPGKLLTKWASLSNPLQNISYHLKIDSLTNNAKAMVIVTGYVNGNVQFSDTVTYAVVTSGWVDETLILSDTSAVCDSVQVSFIAHTTLTPTGYVGYAEFSVDDILLNKPLSLKENNSQGKIINIYPNPAKGVLQIQGSEDLQIISIDLFDNFGKRIRGFEKNELTLNVAGLISGTYFLKISTKEGEISKKLLIE